MKMTQYSSSGSGSGDNSSGSVQRNSKDRGNVPSDEKLTVMKHKKKKTISYYL